MSRNNEVRYKIGVDLDDGDSPGRERHDEAKNRFFEAVLFGEY